MTYGDGETRLALNHEGFMTPADKYLARLNAPICWECDTATGAEKDPRYGVRLCSDKCKKAHEAHLDEEAREMALAETFGCF